MPTTCPSAIQQRTAAVAGIDGRIGLQHHCSIGTADGADDAPRDAVLKHPERESDGNDFLSWPHGRPRCRAAGQPATAARCRHGRSQGRTRPTLSPRAQAGSVRSTAARSPRRGLGSTWRLVMTVRGAAKNPLPRPSPASIDTIAGIAPLTTSSRELGVRWCNGRVQGAMGAIGAIGAIGANSVGASGATGTRATGASRTPSGTIAAACGSGRTGITWSAMRRPAVASPTNPSTIQASVEECRWGSLTLDAPTAPDRTRRTYCTHCTRRTRRTQFLPSRSSTAAHVTSIRHFSAAFGASPGVLRRNETVGHKGVREGESHAYPYPRFPLIGCLPRQLSPKGQIGFQERRQPGVVLSIEGQVTAAVALARSPRDQRATSGRGGEQSPPAG